MKPRANIHRRSGWSVIVWRTEKRVTKFFGDARWRRRAAAPTQSTAYRDRLLRRVPPSRKVTHTLHQHIHIERVGSWAVRIKRRDKVWSRQFPDGPRGPEASLALARAWRDRMLRRVPPYSKLRGRYVLNRTGKVGVALATDRPRNRRIRQRYIATWPGPAGKAAKASFSIAKYGKQEALRLATGARDRGVAELLLARKRNPPIPGEPKSARTAR